MEPAAEFRVIPQEGGKPGAFVAFPYDRELVQRFREIFPRARWRGEEACWFVPGSTAPGRLDAWLSRELAALDRHADAKGRDAYSFDPLTSRYLEVGEDLGIRTPYSRTVVEIMRTIPFAHWDPDGRIWRVPFRSFEALRASWPLIEEAALRNEPEARRRRREETKGQPRDPDVVALEGERRRRRYPVPGDDLPPLGQPVAVFNFGVVVFEELGDDLIGRSAVPVAYPHVREGLSSMSSSPLSSPSPHVREEGFTTNGGEEVRASPHVGEEGFTTNGGEEVRASPHVREEGSRVRIFSPAPVASPQVTEKRQEGMAWQEIHASPQVTEERPGYLWARWRLPTFREIAAVRPRRETEDWSVRAARGWWWPDRGELDERRRILRRTERARQTRERSQT